MKAIKLYLLLQLIVLCSFSKAQNLVPNYSFENIIQCTTGEGEFNGYVDNWTGQTCILNCLALFTHQCAGDSAGGGSVPYNMFDGSYYSFQYAHSGVSYATLLTFVSGGANDTVYPYGSNSSFSNQRNYLQAELISSLDSGIKYYVTFYVNLTNGAWYSCSNIGAYFSSSAPVFSGSGNVLSYTPQVANDPKKQELTDTINWMRISGSFVAAGGEKYVTIGNFNNDSLSSIRYLGQLSSVNAEATYYIDDVIVSPDSNYADSIMGVAQLTVKSEQITIYPNPSNGTFNFQANNQQLMAGCNIAVYNMLGQEVYVKTDNSNRLTANGEIQIDLNGQPNGIYLYRIITPNGVQTQTGKLMVER